MTVFTTLHALQVEKWMPKALKEQAESINADIQTILDRRQQIESLIGDIREQNVGNVSFDFLLIVPDHKAQFAGLLQAELELRTRVDAFYQDFQLELRKAADRTRERHEKAMQEIREKLVAIGYSADAIGNQVGAIQPGCIFRHPKVHALNLEAQSLASRASSNDLRNLNSTAIDQVQNQLSRIRDRALQTL